MQQARKSSGYIKFAWLGTMVGLVLLGCIYTLLLIGYHREVAKAAVRQENLLPARGEAYGAYQAVPVRVETLIDGQSSDHIAVSPDGHRWYTPREGLLQLELMPGEYAFEALYQNRRFYTEFVVRPEEENRLLLDAARAPEAPEWLILEAAADEIQLFPLEITGADAVSITQAVDHVQIVRGESGFAVRVDTGRLAYHFYHLTLIAENPHGQSETRLGIRIRREGAVIPVYTAEDLSAMRHNLSGSYLLMNDLDLSGVEDWAAIGTEAYPFTGVFDGGGHTITGLHAPDSVPDENGFAIFAHIRHAELRQLIIREPVISPRDAPPAACHAALVGVATQSHIENCAVIGGKIAPGQGTASGVVAAANDTFLIGLFNSADIVCRAPNRELKNTGGVCGVFAGYGAYLANEGDVFGMHLTGGVAGFVSHAYLSRCVNSGYISGSTLIGEFPVGALAQTLDNATLTDSYFLAGQAPRGASAFTDGHIRALISVGASDLRNPAALTLLGGFEGPDARWAYASLDARGPVPYGIFTRQAEAPQPVRDGSRVMLPPVDGLVYFYTTDGSDPRTSGERAAQATFRLPAGGALKVYTARLGCRDSDILIYT